MYVIIYYEIHMYTVIVPLLFFRVYTYYLRTCLAAHGVLFLSYTWYITWSLHNFRLHITCGRSKQVVVKVSTYLLACYNQYIPGKCCFHHLTNCAEHLCHNARNSFINFRCSNIFCFDDLCFRFYLHKLCTSKLWKYVNDGFFCTDDVCL